MQLTQLLNQLNIECAKIIQAVSSIRDLGESRQALVQELENLLAVIAAIEHTNYFDLTHSQTNIHSKYQALIKN